MKLFKTHDENTLFCFSPPVMLATLIIEFAGALYILITAKLKPSTTLLVLTLVCLGIFQLAEFQVCSNRSLIWMRVGYAAITLLPPLGIHLISLVTKHTWYRIISYIFGVIFIGAFLFSTRLIQNAVCGGNYVMVSTPSNLITYYYPYYYYILLLVGLLNIMEFINAHKNKPTKDRLENGYLFWIALGYATFLIPTGAVYFLSQSARRGIPSIMCGFAVFLALILIFKVYPISKKLDI